MRPCCRTGTWPLAAVKLLGTNGPRTVQADDVLAGTETAPTTINDAAYTWQWSLRG